MATANKAGPSHGMQFNFSNSQTEAGRDVASRNKIWIQNNYGSSESADKVKEVLAWLKPHAVDYFPAHEEAHSRQTPGTGAWFFGTRTYTMWRGVDSESGPPNLECVGIPGAGKTTLASAIIENLQPGDDDDSNIVLYAYFRHDTQSHQKIPNVLASLLQQVVQSKRNVSDELYKLYEACSRSGIIPAPDRIISIMCLELSVFRKVFIVVDALDEYSTETYSLSHDLVSHLERMEARLLITSRHRVDFTPNTFSSLDISAKAEDIRIMVLDHVKGNLAKIIHRTPGILEEIVDTVVTKAEGMFIIAKLLIESIPHLLAAADIRTALKLLPTGLRDTYLMTMARIWKQDPHIADLGKKTLSWVFLAKRRLTVLELQHAVSVRSGEPTWSGEDLISEEVILSSCLGLVVFVNSKDGVLEYQFAHFTTKEFLEKCWQDYFPDGEKQITETCLAYLAATISAIPPELTERIIHIEELWRRDKDVEWTHYRTVEYALCAYAATFWGAHAKAFDGMIPLDAYASFFKDAISPYVAHPRSDNGPRIFPTIAMPPAQYWTLYLAGFGLLEFLQRHAAAIQKHNKTPEVPLNYNDIRDESGRTALHLAALYGHLNVVEFLLDSGANVNQLDNYNDGPLHFAVEAGNPGVAIVQLLLDHGAIADQPNQYDRAPISLAIVPSYTSNQLSPETISLLLQHEVDIYRLDDYGKTPLSRTQKSENAAIKQLFEEYARSHPPKRRGYRHNFPGGHRSGWDSISEITHSEPTMPVAVPSVTSEREASRTGNEASSTTRDSGVEHEPPMLVPAATIVSKRDLTLQVGSAVGSHVDLEPPTTTLATIESKGRVPRTGFRQFFRGFTHSFHRRRK